MALLELSKVTMRFGGLTAVNQLDLKVEPGQIVSVIGPNGAGKTTAFNVITGIYEPTEGTIRFDGRELKRPFNWKVLLACALVGLVTGLGAFLAMINVDRLWYAAIKRNMADPHQPFTYTAAGRELVGYVAGDLALEKRGGTRWAVVTADGKQTLANLPNKEMATAMLPKLNALVALAGSDRTLQQREGKWVILSDSGEELARFDTAEEARDRLQFLAKVGTDRAAKLRNAGLALMLGVILGAAGTYAVWNRSRRTPDVIALGGIGRTFQNIRLFQNMTALENVLMGMDRYFKVGVIRMMLRTPGVRKEEFSGQERAQVLLEFVGIGGKRDLIAKNLPYGDQRRLEIARALATHPRLLMLDEPAAGMNPSETGELIELIRRIRKKGITVVLIEHHMNVVMGISDRIAVLDYGVKIAAGTPAEVRANPKVIEAYLGKEDVS